MKRRECMEQETFDERDKVVKSLERGNFESTLITVVTKVIHENVDLLYDMKPKTENSAKRSDFVCSLSQKNDSQIIELRELLKSSEGACIEQFPDKAKLMETSVDEQREHLNSHVYLQWQRNWENVLLHSIREAVKTMDVPLAETKTYKKKSLTCVKKLIDTEEGLSLSDTFRACSVIQTWLVTSLEAVSCDTIRLTVHWIIEKFFCSLFLTDLEVEYIGNDRRFAIVKKRSVTNSKDEGHFIVDFARKKMVRSNDEGRALKDLVSRGWKLLKLSDD